MPPHYAGVFRFASVNHEKGQIVSLLAKSVTSNALNHRVYRAPTKATRKSYASKRDNTKPSDIKVFVFHEDGVIKNIQFIKPSKPRHG